MRNQILKKILVILLCVIGVILVLVLAIKVLVTNTDLYYNLKDIDVYSDTVIYDYDEYKEFVKFYKIRKDLKKSDFNNNSYIATFQDYDKCSESKVKTISSADVKDDTIIINFDVYNKCGWCKSEVVLYLIKSDKLQKKEYEFKYNYNYDKQLNCGKI